MNNLLKRPKDEIQTIHKILDAFSSYCSKNKIHDSGVRIRVIGDLSMIPVTIRQKYEKLVEETKKYKAMYLNLAIGYDGLENIKQMAREEHSRPKIDIGNIDIVIRTGFEKRMSGFFPWHTMYSEWFFLDMYYPEFNIKVFKRVLKKYKKRKRNFGA